MIIQGVDVVEADEKKCADKQSDEGENAVKLVAVIDVGATSVRMAVAQIDSARNIHHLESLTQAVNLGRDTFTRGSISADTTELCAKAFLSFRHVLREYNITDARQIRAVATNAVREAGNRQSFLDRIYIATGIDLQVIEESEANRFTYMGVQPLIETDKRLKKKTVSVIEVGGGSTEVLTLQKGHVVNSHTYRLGTLRLRRMLEEFRAPASRKGQLMETHIGNTIEQIVRAQGGQPIDRLVMLGGDMRFAAHQLDKDWNEDGICVIKTKELSRLTSAVLGHSVDELVLKYNLHYPDAETLGPALLAYSSLAEAMDMDKVYIGTASLRDGLLYEIAHEGAWSEEFLSQIRESVLKVGRKYEFDEDHANHVCALVLQLYDELRDYHQLEPDYRVIIQIAALLHEIGLFISDRSHHKHSLYLIQSSDIFGLSSRQKMLAALTARYHRKAAPKPSHTQYEQLSRQERICISKMAALLRVADALDTSHSRRIQKLEISQSDDHIEIDIPGEMDLSLEQLALRRKGNFFKQVYGKDVILRSSRKGA